MKLLITHTASAPFSPQPSRADRKLTKTLANVSWPQDRGLIPGFLEYEATHSTGDVATEQAVAMLLYIPVGVHGHNVTARSCETHVLRLQGEDQADGVLWAVVMQLTAPYQQLTASSGL